MLKSRIPGFTCDDSQEEAGLVEITGKDPDRSHCSGSSYDDSSRYLANLSDDASAAGVLLFAIGSTATIGAWTPGSAFDLQAPPSGRVGSG